MQQIKDTNTESVSSSAAAAAAAAAAWTVHCDRTVGDVYLLLKDSKFAVCSPA